MSLKDSLRDDEVMELTGGLLALADELEREADRIRRLVEPRPCVGYVIAERHTFGPNEGKLDADWDGEIHPSREVAEAELALANGQDGCCEGAHWKLYELREVTE